MEPLITTTNAREAASLLKQLIQSGQTSLSDLRRLNVYGTFKKDGSPPFTLPFFLPPCKDCRRKAVYKVETTAQRQNGPLSQETIPRGL